MSVLILPIVLIEPMLDSDGVCYENDMYRM